MADLRLADDGFDGFFKNVGLFEKLDSNENIEQIITDFLGSDWFDNTEKFVYC
ncbi:MAG: hypothetical protein QQN43_06305 [Nitrosopumilus sp.]